MYDEVINNIKKSISIKEKNFTELQEGAHILIKKNYIVKGKRIAAIRGVFFLYSPAPPFFKKFMRK